jgi:hypothetical protein
MWMPSLASTSCARSARACRRGDRRITEKSAVPPPTSITSTTCSRCDGALEVERRRDGLQLEFDWENPAARRMPPASSARRDRGRISSSTKRTGRPSTTASGAARVLGGALAQRRRVQRHDVGEAHVAIADGGRLVHEAAAEQALERAHQPARRPVEVFAHRGAPVVRRVRLVRGEEDGRRHRRCAILQRHEAHAAARGHAHARIGRAEVEAARDSAGSSHVRASP